MLYIYNHASFVFKIGMGWPRLVGSIKLSVSFAELLSLLQGSIAKETYQFIDSANQSHPIKLPPEWDLDHRWDTRH